jgi:ParB-like nuclease domain
MNQLARVSMFCGGLVELDSAASSSPTSENALVKHLSLQQADIEHSIVARVPIESLVASGSPRLDGENLEHIHMLAESDGALPPIVVHLPSRQVIDGMHRLRAAIMRGEKDIEARFFYGSATDVFLLSVAANIQHGLPLTQKDRMAAAERIFAIHPEWSDRMVSIVVALSGKKIAALRRLAADHTPQSAVRIGRDGRSRPVDGTAGRERAARLIASDPTASLRQIAQEAGIALATAADVRHRISRGEDPIPSRRGTQPKRPDPAERTEVAGHEGALPANLISESAAILKQLCKDPSLRFTEAGRTLLRMFEACQATVRDEEAIKKGLPPHRLASVAELSFGYAAVLQTFAAELQKLQSTHSAEGCKNVG